MLADTYQLTSCMDSQCPIARVLLPGSSLFQHNTVQTLLIESPVFNSRSEGVAAMDRFLARALKRFHYRFGAVDFSFSVVELDEYGDIDHPLMHESSTMVQCKGIVEVGQSKPLVTCILYPSEGSDAQAALLNSATVVH